MLFRARQFSFTFPRSTLIMGIVNVTPDSFSDGGKFLNPELAVAHALKLMVQGADILDIGGESTRPGASPVSEEEELNRVLPVIEQLEKLVSVPLSIDTMKPAVARAALKAGASIVNDVAAAHRGRRANQSIEADPHLPFSNRGAVDVTQFPMDEMWQLVAEFKAGYICMHMQGTPQTMQADPVYLRVVEEVDDYFRDRLWRLHRSGIAPEQVVFDPGIGFGKTLEHNLQLLASLRAFTRLGRPLLLGVSRKSFLEKLTGAPAADRLPGSLACATLAAEVGVQIIRAHDVAETVSALRVTEAILARRK